MFTSSPVWSLSLLSSHYFSPPSFFSLHTCLKVRCALRDKWEHRKPFICLFSTFFPTLCLLIFPSHTAAPAPSMHKCIRALFQHVKFKTCYAFLTRLYKRGQGFAPTDALALILQIRGYCKAPKTYETAGSCFFVFSVPFALNNTRGCLSEDTHILYI